MSQPLIYLGKDGKVSGPFTSGQIEELRQSGELYSYTYIWDKKTSGWKAIEEEVELPDVLPGLPPQGNNDATRVLSSVDSISIICHDHHLLLSGKLLSATQEKCIFESKNSIYELAAFKSGTKVLLNFLNINNGRSENLSAIIDQVKRGDEFWQYQVNWDQSPQLLKDFIR